MLVVLAAIPVRSARALLEPKYLPADAEAVVTLNLEGDTRIRPRQVAARSFVRQGQGQAQGEGTDQLAGQGLLQEGRLRRLLQGPALDSLHRRLRWQGHRQALPRRRGGLRRRQDSRRRRPQRRRGEGRQASGNVPTLEISAGEDQKTIHAGILSEHIIIAAGTRALLTEGIARSNSAAKAAAEAGPPKSLPRSRQGDAGPEHGGGPPTLIDNAVGSIAPGTCCRKTWASR